MILLVRLEFLFLHYLTYQGRRRKKLIIVAECMIDTLSFYIRYLTRVPNVSILPSSHRPSFVYITYNHPPTSPRTSTFNSYPHSLPTTNTTSAPPPLHLNRRIVLVITAIITAGKSPLLEQSLLFFSFLAQHFRLVCRWIVGVWD